VRSSCVQAATPDCPREHHRCYTAAGAGSGPDRRVRRSGVPRTGWICQLSPPALGGTPAPLADARVVVNGPANAKATVWTSASQARTRVRVRKAAAASDDRRRRRRRLVMTPEDVEAAKPYTQYRGPASYRSHIEAAAPLSCFDLSATAVRVRRLAIRGCAQTKRRASDGTVRRSSAGVRPTAHSRSPLVSTSGS
jgi:hypothetical protein